MSEHMQRCREWMAHTGGQMSSVSIPSPRIILYGIVFLGLASWLLIRTTKFLTKPTSEPRTPDIERRASWSKFKAPPRKPGGLYHRVTSLAGTDNLIVWEPVDFKRPTAPPAPDWNVKPKPYRPFRHGPYHITMGLRNMDWDEWIGERQHYTGSSRMLS
jgi:hypothetical protein